MSPPRTHKQIIELWPTRAEFARAIGVREGAARGMYAAGKIPPKHFRAVTEATRACGFPVATYAELSGSPERTEGMIVHG